jgi:DNA repair exonuclease SbcCD ATPase subunit
MVMRKANLTTFVQIALVSGFITLSIGCGKAKPLSDSSVGSANVNNMPEMKEINNKVEALDAQTQNVVQQINGLSAQNPLSLLSGSMFGGGLTSSLTQFSGLGTDLTSQIDALKEQLTQQMGQLNASNPQQAQMLAQLQGAMGNLDQVTGRLQEVVGQLQTKINDVFAKLESKLSGLGGIQGMIAQMILGQLKNSVLKHLTIGI